MINAAVVGATGYTALELIQRLIRHPHARVTVVTSRQDSGKNVAAIHPRLHGQLDLPLTMLDAADIRQQADVVFTCLPHAASAEVVATIVDDNTRVIDFSADYRLNDLDVYSKWYGVTHPDPDRVGKVPYGLPELFAEQIATASVVANPGCFPTGAILALAPMLAERLISCDDMIVDSKSGVSGAGRTPKLVNLFPECNESVAAYGVGQHRHTPEIRQLLSGVAGTPVSLIFTPHLIPMDRGILTTAYACPTDSNRDESFYLEYLRTFYRGKPFVRVVEHLPATKHVSGTNFCDISVRVVDRRVIIFSAIDNLVKGASGAAVQNMNIMYGFDETDGLL